MRNAKINRIIQGAQARQYHIWLTSRLKASFQGWIVHPATSSGQHFESLLEMVSLIDDKLEELNITRLATEKRFFEENFEFKPHICGDREEEQLSSMNELISFEKPIRKPEFLIKILMRQNSSWQGEIRWLNSDKVIHFRSMLEMVMLIQEAMDLSGEPEAEYKFRSWQEDGGSFLSESV